MRFLRLRKRHLEVIKLVLKIIHFIVKKCWLQFVCLAGLLFLIYYVFGAIIGFLITFTGLTYVLHLCVDSFLYYPDDPPDSRVNVCLPSAVKLPGTSIFIQTPDGVEINIVLIRQEADVTKSTAPTIVYFHGNAGNVGHRLINAKELYQTVKCNILLVEYRGYGLSKGRPSESGLYLDAEAAMKYILGLPGIDKTKIILFGRSLGGAVAIDLAKNPKFSSHVSALIVENTFTSIPDVARILFNLRLVRWLPKWFYRSKFDSLNKIKNVTVPALFLSGLQDELIPPAMMHSLFQACGSNSKHFHSFDSGTHNHTWRCKNYYNLINSFLIKVFNTENHIDDPHNISHPDAFGSHVVGDTVSTGLLNIPSVLSSFQANRSLNKLDIFEMERGIGIETV